MPEVSAPPAPSPYTRSNPFPARLAVNRLMSGADSEKETRHFEIDLKSWGLSFEPGDSMAVYPTNDPNLLVTISIVCEELTILLPSCECLYPRL